MTNWMAIYSNWEPLRTGPFSSWLNTWWPGVWMPALDGARRAGWQAGWR
jgi:hypothetical protein